MATANCKASMDLWLWTYLWHWEWHTTFVVRRGALNTSPKHNNTLSCSLSLVSASIFFISDCHTKGSVPYGPSRHVLNHWSPVHPLSQLYAKYDLFASQVAFLKPPSELAHVCKHRMVPQPQSDLVKSLTVLTRNIRRITVSRRCSSATRRVQTSRKRRTDLESCGQGALAAWYSCISAI